jgi:hypothetical protein
MVTGMCFLNMWLDHYWFGFWSPQPSNYPPPVVRNRSKGVIPGLWHVISDNVSHSILIAFGLDLEAKQYIMICTNMNVY